MSHQYTIATRHGDVNLTTDRHHSTFDTVHEFYKHHHDVIADALNLASIVLTGMQLYLSHGRRGSRLH